MWLKIYQIIAPEYYTLNMNPGVVAIFVKIPKETQIQRTDFWTLWEKVRVGWFERIALKHVYYHMWNESPVQVRCMVQDARAGALGWPRGIGWGGRWEGGSGWGTHVHTWLIHVTVWQNHYSIVISLQLNKILKKKKNTKITMFFFLNCYLKWCFYIWKCYQSMA